MSESRFEIKLKHRGVVLLPLLLLMTVAAWAQAPNAAIKSAKRCAFDLSPQTIRDMRLPQKSVSNLWWESMPSAEPLCGEIGNPCISMGYPTPVRAVPTREVCPYEHAIQVFGEDRVTFEEGKSQKSVLVDGNPIYKE